MKALLAALVISLSMQSAAVAGPVDYVKEQVNESDYKYWESVSDPRVLEDAGWTPPKKRSKARRIASQVFRFSMLPIKAASVVVIGISIVGGVTATGGLILLKQAEGRIAGD